MFVNKVCKMCLNTFTPKSNRSIYCGSRYKKTGCAYINRLNLSIQSQNRNREFRKKYMNIYETNNKENLIEYRKEYYSKKRVQKKDYSLKYNYGISLDEYNEKLLSQNNRCAICKREKLLNEKSFAVDHNHETEKVRGILCHGCNAGIGCFIENTQFLEEAINYLNKWK